MSDRIEIADLEVSWRVGVPDHERSRPQRLLLTISMETDVTVAAKTDDLARTIDYYAVTRRIQGLGEGREWRLIESLAVEIAELVLRDYGPKRVTVEVKKFILPSTQWVSVRVERALPLAKG
ncbi:MAG: dihydroneopterin aldolase [Verrucomicrobiales bacterium]|nr:dihydroneopterin aldolase [Verrucomicrobiales bacterium]